MWETWVWIEGHGIEWVFKIMVDTNIIERWAESRTLNTLNFEQLNGKLPEFLIHTIALMHHLAQSNIFSWQSATKKKKKKKTIAKIIELWSTIKAKRKEETKTFNLTMSRAHFDQRGRCTRKSRQWKTPSSHLAALHSTTTTQNERIFTGTQKVVFWCSLSTFSIHAIIQQLFILLFIFRESTVRCSG